MSFGAVCTIVKKRFQSSAKSRCLHGSFQFSRQLVPRSWCSSENGKVEKYSCLFDFSYSHSWSKRLILHLTIVRFMHFRYHFCLINKHSVFSLLPLSVFSLLPLLVLRTINWLRHKLPVVHMALLITPWNHFYKTATLKMSTMTNIGMTKRRRATQLTICCRTNQLLVNLQKDE